MAMTTIRARRAQLSRAGLIAGAVAGPLFMTTALVEGARRADYHPARHPISSLALGPRRSVQVANFLLAGALYGGFAVGLRWSTPPASGTRGVSTFVANVAAGLVVSGLFRTDPVSGYPPGTPNAAELTGTGMVHNLAAMPLVVGVSGAAFVEGACSLRAGRRAWAGYCLASGLLMPSTFVLAGAGFGQQPRLVGRAGLLQRISVCAGFGWLTSLAIRRLVSTPASMNS
jgi:hypothetical protein